MCTCQFPTMYPLVAISTIREPLEVGEGHRHCFCAAGLLTWLSDDLITASQSRPRQFSGMMTAGCRATLDRHQSQSWNLASVWNDRKGSTQLSEFQRLTLRGKHAVDKRPRNSTDSCARRCFAVTPQSTAFRCTKHGNGCQLCRFFFSPTRSA